MTGLEQVLGAAFLFCLGGLAESLRAAWISRRRRVKPEAMARYREAARQWWLDHPEEAEKMKLPPDGRLP